MIARECLSKTFKKVLLFCFIMKFKIPNVNLGQFKKYFNSLNFYWFVSKFAQYKRVLRRSKKPSLQEFKDIIKVCLAGITIIGVVGFLIQTIFIFIIKI